MQFVPMSAQDLRDLVQNVVLTTIKNLHTNPVLDSQKSIAVDDQQYDIAGLATYLCCTKTTVQAYKRRGVFPYYQTGRTIYFKKSEVDAALASNRKGVKSAA